MSMQDELWLVKLANGDVFQATLDQIDEAFNAGRIDGNVMVMEADGTQWAKLSELAGLDGPQPAPTPTPAPVVYPVYAPAPSSLRPMTVDLGPVEYPAAAFKSSSGKKWAFAAVALALVGGGITVAASQSGASTEAAPAMAAAVAPPPAMTVPPAAAPTPTTDSTSDTRLSEAQRQKLQEADKQLEQKMKARQDSRAGAASVPHTSHSYKSQGFTTGGNKYDPLNASL